MSTKVKPLTTEDFFDCVFNREMDYAQFCEQLDAIHEQRHADLNRQIEILEARLVNATNLNNSLLDDFAKKGLAYK